MNDHELLTQMDGIGDDKASKLLAYFGDGRGVATSACRYWGEITNVDGITENAARSMFDRMHDAGVFYDLRGY